MDDALAGIKSFSWMSGRGPTMKTRASSIRMAVLVATVASFGPLARPCCLAVEQKPRASLKAGRVNSVAFSPDGKTLASGGYHGTVKLWNVATAREKAT